CFIVKMLIDKNIKYKAPIACICQTSTKNEIINKEPKRKINAPINPENNASLLSSKGKCFTIIASTSALSAANNPSKPINTTKIQAYSINNCASIYNNLL